MIPLSKAAMNMSWPDRTKQELSWYAGEINICTNGPAVAAEIEEECKRRNIVYGSVWTRELIVGRNYSHLDLTMIPYNIYKIKIPMSLEADNNPEVQKYLPGCYVPALKKKQLADWAVTTFNGEETPSRTYDSECYIVWIQPSSDVELYRGCGYFLEEDGVETQWVKFR